MVVYFWRGRVLRALLFPRSLIQMDCLAWCLDLTLAFGVVGELV